MRAWPPLIAILAALGFQSSAIAQSPLTAVQEQTLKPLDIFKECDVCPEMVVVPAGSFALGSPESEADRADNEGPQHRVTIGKPFALGKFELTVDQLTAFVTETGYDAGSVCDIWLNGTWEE